MRRLDWILIGHAGLVVAYVGVYLVGGILQHRAFRREAAAFASSVAEQLSPSGHTTGFLYANRFHGWGYCNVGLLLDHPTDGQFLLTLGFSSSWGSSTLRRAELSEYPAFGSESVDVTAPVRDAGLRPPRELLAAAGIAVDPAEQAAERERLADPERLIERLMRNSRDEEPPPVESPLLREVMTRVGCTRPHRVAELAFVVTLLSWLLAALAALAVSLPLLRPIAPAWVSRLPRWAWVGIIVVVVLGWPLVLVAFAVPLSWLLLPAPRGRFTPAFRVGLVLAALGLIGWPMLSIRPWWRASDAGVVQLWMAGNVLQVLGLLAYCWCLGAGLREGVGRLADLQLPRGGWRGLWLAAGGCALLGVGALVVTGVFLWAPEASRETETQVLVRCAGALAASLGAVLLLVAVLLGGRSLWRSAPGPGHRPLARACVAGFPTLVLAPLVWVVMIAARPL